MILERCFKFYCAYELEIDPFLAGEALSDGLCPLCGASAIFECPSCRLINVTKWRIRALVRCEECAQKLEPCNKCRKAPLTCSRCRELVRDSAAELQYKMRQRDAARRGLAIGRTHLSPREVEVLELTAEGLATKEISARLGISERTVCGYRNRIMIKTRVRCVAHLVHFALENKFISVLPISKTLFPNK